MTKPHRMAVLGSFILWLLRLVLAPPSTLSGSPMGAEGDPPAPPAARRLTRPASGNRRVGQAERTGPAGGESPGQAGPVSRWPVNGMT